MEVLIHKYNQKRKPYNDYDDNFTDYNVLNTTKDKVYKGKLLYFIPIIIPTLLYIYIQFACSNERIEVAFFPKDEAKKQIINAIKTAKESIIITDNTIISYDLIQSLNDVYRKNVKIFYLIDETASPSLLVRQFIENSINFTRIVVSPKVARSDLMIIDEKKVITSHFEYSLFSEKFNVDNSVIYISSYNIAKNLIQHIEYAVELTNIGFNHYYQR
jgi:hypothetical protein